MTETRKTRDADTRTESVRYEYKPSSSLPDPKPEPGYTFRWIATAVHGNSEVMVTNVSRRLRDGYVPVKAEDHPEMMIPGNPKTGNIEIGGLMLCKIPTGQAEAIGRYFNGQAQNQMESVDNSFLRQNDPRMPLFADRKSSVTRGGNGS
jgi:hypothetical protein